MTATFTPAKAMPTRPAAVGDPGHLATHQGLHDAVAEVRDALVGVVGQLNKVDNTSDAGKPVSAATKAAIDALAFVKSVNGTLPDGAGNVAVAVTGGTSTVTASQVTDTTTTGRSIMTATDPAAARSALGVTTTSALSLTDQTSVDITGWSVTGEPTSNGFYAPKAPPVRYDRTRPRMAIFDDPARFVRDTVGDAKGTVSLVAGRNSSPNPTGHLKFTNPGFNGTRWGMRLDSPADLRNAYVRFAAKTTGLANVRWVQFFFATSQADYAAGNYLRHSGLASTSNWMRSFFLQDAAHPALMTVAGTGADLSNIGYIVIGLASSTTGNSFDFELAFMEPVPTASSKAKVVICHDDSTADSFSNFVAYMAEYNFPGTEAAQYGTLNGSTGNSFLNVNEVRAAQFQHGWQFASHSFNYDGHGDVDAASIYSQAIKNRAVAQAVGVHGADDFTWWGGLSASEANYSAVRRAYRSGRWNTASLQVPEMLPPADPWMMKSNLVSGEDFTSWKALVDNAIATNGMAIFTFHAFIGSPTAANAKQFRQLLNYLDANRDKVDVVTIDEALATCTGYPTKAARSIAAVTPTTPTLTVSSPFGSGNATISVKARYATGYKVFRGTTAGVATTGTPLTTIDSMEAYVDSSTVPGTTYWYKVVATNGNGSGPASAEVSVTVSNTGSATPVSTDFSTMPTGWQQSSDLTSNASTTGTWSVTDGQLRLSGSSTTGQNNYQYISPYLGSASNEFAQIDATAASTSTTPLLPRVVINYADASNYAYGVFSYSDASTGTWRIYAVVGGVSTPVFQSASSSAPTLPVTIRLERSGTTYNLKVNGSSVGTAGGATLTGVGTGVMIRAGSSGAAASETQRLDNFSTNVVA